MRDFLILGYVPDKQYSLVSVTNVGRFALVTSGGGGPTPVVTSNKNFFAFF